MKNNILFLSLILLFTLPLHAENPADPNDWFNDSMDDDFDPNTQSVIKELLRAATTRHSSSSTTTAQQSPQERSTPLPTTTKGQKSEKPKMKESRASIQARKTQEEQERTKQQEAKKAHALLILQQKTQQRIVTLEIQLEANETNAAIYQASIDELNEKKTSCRWHELGGVLLVVGAIYGRCETVITVVPTVALSAIGLMYTGFNEAYAQTYTQQTQEKESQLSGLNQGTETLESELENLRK